MTAATLNSSAAGKQIIERCKCLGYSGAIQNEEDLTDAVDGSSQSVAFAELVSWLAQELRFLYDLEESVHPMVTIDDSASFILEVSAFLKDLGCPLPRLTEGPTSQRLSTPHQRLQLLHFLLSELEAARMSTVNGSAGETSGAGKTQIRESADAEALRSIMMNVGLAKPPPTVTEKEIFDKIRANLVKRLDYAKLDRPLFTGHLSPDQWMKLKQLNDRLNAEYKVRAKMLLQRVDVTIQSFAWSDRIKKMEDQVSGVYRPKRNKLDWFVDNPHVNISDLLAAREDVKHIEKTSSANVRAKTQSRVNKVLMKGRVPDRGGRPSEIEPPPPEMPPWQKDRAPDRGRGGRGGRGTHNSPGRHGYAGGAAPQGGGWSQQPQPQRQQYGLNFAGGGGQFQAQYQAPGYGQYNMASIQQQQQFQQPQYVDQSQSYGGGGYGGHRGGGGHHRGGGGGQRGRGRGRY